MNAERLREALASNTVVYGTWVQTPSPEVVEIITQHGSVCVAGTIKILLHKSPGA